MRCNCNQAFALFLIVTGTLAAFPQIPPISTTQKPIDPAYTLKAGTQRVLVDVIVKDKNGRAVHGLKATDFTISENGQPQEIRGFDEHTGLNAAEAAAIAKTPTLPPGEFTNFVATPPNSAVNVILLDKLNTAQSDQQFVRQQLVEYLKHARPDARTAIFALTDHLILLNGFTSNPAVLLKALELKDSTRASVLRDDTLGNNAGTAGLEDLEQVLLRAGFADTLTNVQSFDASYRSFQSQIRSKYTLDALNQIGRSLVSVPGRKNLIWFTGNFPAGLFPGDNDPSVPYGQFAGLENEFRETVDLLTSNQISIYPVDAQGLRTSTINNASQSNQKYGSIKEGMTRQGAAISVDTAKESNGIATEHLGMAQIAHDTGGEPFYNSNNLALAVDQAIMSGSNYYTIAYAPSNPEAKTLFRRIYIQLSGEKYQLSYRRGYYTDVLRDGTVPSTAIPGVSSMPSSLRGALLQGGPEPTEILLKVKAAPTSAGREASVAQGNQLNPDGSKVKPPFRTFQVDFAASIKAILIRHTSDKMYHADVDFITYVYDTEGVLINAQSNTVHTNYTAAELAAHLRSGLPFTQLISVPVSGEYFLRVAVHDNIGDKVGAVEIPVSVLNHLPATAPAAPSASQSALSPSATP